MNLRKFWTYYEPFVNSLNKGNKEEAIKILEDMGTSFPGERWKGMVLKFVDHFGPVPDHIHTMMILSPVDENLKEYLNEQLRTE